MAVVLTSNYVKTSIQNQTASLAEQYSRKQKEMVTQLQQRSEQQMAILAQQVDALKKQQAQDQQAQAALIQQAQQQVRAQMAAQSTVKPKLRKPSVALKTPAGKRAVTVMIDSLAAVGGLLNAGDYVDVIAQLNVPAQDQDKKTVTAMIFQGLQILAINTNIDDPGDYDAQQAGSLRVTLAVDPQETGLLAFAIKSGTLQLALRSPDESARPMIKAGTWKTLTDYVMKNQGYDIKDPDGEGGSKTTTAKPNIQIFRGGKEL